MSRTPLIPAAELRSRDRVWLQQPARRGLRRHVQGEILAVNGTSALVDVDERHDSTVLVLVPATDITHVWRQLSSSAAPSLLPVTHKPDRAERSRGRGWRGDKARRKRAGTTKTAVRMGGHEPSERGTA